MPVLAADYNKTTDAGAIVADAVRSLRDAREKVLRAHAVLDALRDDGSVGSFFATKVGAPNTTEAGKVFDEVASLKGYVESTAPDTFGAAALQACARLGV